MRSQRSSSTHGIGCGPTLEMDGTGFGTKLLRHVRNIKVRRNRGDYGVHAILICHDFAVVEDQAKS